MSERKLGRISYREYIASEQWKEIAAHARWAAEHRCQFCNRNDFQLEVHHRDYSRLGCEKPGDLYVLCSYCHASLENAEKHREEALLKIKDNFERIGRIRMSIEDADDNLRADKKVFANMLLDLEDMVACFSSVAEQLGLERNVVYCTNPEAVEQINNRNLSVALVMLQWCDVICPGIVPMIGPEGTASDDFRYVLQGERALRRSQSTKELN